MNMTGMRYRISIEVLENAFEVEIPDMEAMKKKMAEAKKAHKGAETAPMPYMGDLTKKYAAKSVKEVLALVKGSLEKMPENEYEAAFDEAAKTPH